MLNANRVKTEEELAALLEELGFDSEPLPANWQLFRERIPARVIFKGRDFEDGGPVILAVQRDAFEIYYYDWHVVYFYCWKVFKGDISADELRQWIEAAGSKKAMESVYPQFSE